MGYEIFAAALFTVAGTHLTADPVVHQAIVEMLGKTRNGFSHLEEAVFIIRDADGRTTTVEWPQTEIPDSATWLGPIPDGAIAIAHTHPNWKPRPSGIDMATARTARMPVYVVTQSQLWETAAGVAFRVH